MKKDVKTKNSKVKKNDLESCFWIILILKVFFTLMNIYELAISDYKMALLYTYVSLIPIILLIIGIYFAKNNSFVAGIIGIIVSIIISIQLDIGSIILSIIILYASIKHIKSNKK